MSMRIHFIAESGQVEKFQKARGVAPKSKQGNKEKLINAITSEGKKEGNEAKSV